MISYRLALADRGTAGLGTVIEDDIQGRTGIPDGDPGVIHNRALADPGSLEFSLPPDDPFVTQANFEPLSHEIHLYREEVLQFAGPLLTSEWTSRTAVRFTAKGAGWWLTRREVDDDLVYNNVDQLDIAWGLIAFTQARTGGALGITRGDATPSGVARWLSYCLDARPNVWDEILALGATEDGFDPEVGPDKVFRTWSPMRGQTLSITLDTAVNVIGLTGFQIDGSDVSTEVTGIKGGGNCETPVTELALDSAGRDAYGLLQSNVVNNDVTAAHLQSIAEDQLRISKGPRIQPSVVLDASIADIRDVPDLSEYDLGDQLTLQASMGFLTFDRLFRIVEISVLHRPLGLERVTLKLDSALIP